MEYVEIILQDIPIRFFEAVLTKQLQFHPTDVLSSHFFSSAVGEACQYADIRNWDAFFHGKGASGLFLARLTIGMELKNAVVLLSHETDPGDITIHFGADQLQFTDGAKAERAFQKLFQRLADISRDCKVGGILIGYEPADDWDMQILAIRRGMLRTFPQNISHAPELQSLCRVGNMYAHSFADS